MTTNTLPFGDSAQFSVALKQSDGTSPANLSGLEVDISFYDSKESLVLTFNGTVDDAPNGLCHFDLSASDSEALLLFEQTYEYRVRARSSTATTTYVIADLQII
jgi:hypothetical protein